EVLEGKGGALVDPQNAIGFSRRLASEIEQGTDPQRQALFDLLRESPRPEPPTDAQAPPTAPIVDAAYFEKFRTKLADLGRMGDVFAGADRTAVDLQVELGWAFQLFGGLSQARAGGDLVRLAQAGLPAVIRDFGERETELVKEFARYQTTWATLKVLWDGVQGRLSRIHYIN